MITVSSVNQKGGVGKSSVALHLAGALVDLGHKVLLVDQDPQASLAQGLLGPVEAAKLPAERTAAAIAGGDGPDPRNLILRVSEGRELHLVPGSPDAAKFNLASPFEFETRARLRHFLAECSEELGFDVCLVDCPPNLGMASAEALAASEFMLVPTEPQDFGAQGLLPVLSFMEDVRQHDNPALKLCGIVLNRRKARVGLHSTFEKRLRDHYGASVFAATVPETVAYAESITYQMPITWHDKNSNAAIAIRAVALEFLTRIGADLP